MDCQASTTMPHVPGTKTCSSREPVVEAKRPKPTAGEGKKKRGEREKRRRGGCALPIGLTPFFPPFGPLGPLTWPASGEKARVGRRMSGERQGMREDALTWRGQRERMEAEGSKRRKMVVISKWDRMATRKRTLRGRLCDAGTGQAQTGTDRYRKGDMMRKKPRAVDTVRRYLFSWAESISLGAHEPRNLPNILLRRAPEDEQMGKEGVLNIFNKRNNSQTRLPTLQRAQPPRNRRGERIGRDGGPPLQRAAVL